MTQISLHHHYPSNKQKNYLFILFNDCGFTRESRNAWLTHRYSRLIKDLDDLNIVEASDIIEVLKGIRAQQKDG